MKYIWQQDNWPAFIWQSPKAEMNAYAYAMEAGNLVGQISHLSEAEKTDALIDLMVSEAVKTSKIEGELYDRDDVRSSIRNQLGIAPSPENVKDPRANGVSALMISVSRNYAEDLTAERLFEWHDMLISDKYVRKHMEIGQWRTDVEPMQIVSGVYGREKVHYEAPPSKDVPAEMERFIKWFNDSRGEKGPVRAAIAHLYFEVIHPFADGNGRIGRAISEVALSQDLGHPAILSLSSTIEAHRKEYYEALSKASQGGMDITAWVEWFTGLVLEAQLQAKEQIDFVLAKARFWDNFGHILNERQTKVAARMLKEGLSGFEGGMSAQKYMKLADCSKATATRDLSDLVERGAFKKQEGGGRSTRYDVKLIY